MGEGMSRNIVTEFILEIQWSTLWRSLLREIDNSVSVHIMHGLMVEILVVKICGTFAWIMSSMFLAQIVLRWLKHILLLVSIVNFNLNLMSNTIIQVDNVLLFYLVYVLIMLHIIDFLLLVNGRLATFWFLVFLPICWQWWFRSCLSPTSFLLNLCGGLFFSCSLLFCCLIWWARKLNYVSTRWYNSIIRLVFFLMIVSNDVFIIIRHIQPVCVSSSRSASWYSSGGWKIYCLGFLKLGSILNCTKILYVLLLNRWFLLKLLICKKA